MKVRESGMPERDMWEKLFDPLNILMQMGLNSQVCDVVDVGCGYGTFTIPVAKVISGQIHAYDIDEEMIHITQAEAEKAKLNNVNAVLRDITADGTGLPDESVDYVMLFNILHLETPALLLKEAYRVLKNGGRLGIIHWNYDPSTPRGPSMEIRPKPEDCIGWGEQAGFHLPQKHDLKPYHYGVVLIKLYGVKSIGCSAMKKQGVDMKKFLLTVLISTVTSLGIASSNVSAMSNKHSAEHPMVDATESEHPKAAEPATSAEGLERLLSEHPTGADEQVATSKPKDHPAH